MKSKRLPYHLVDVFTDRAFGGNPLAVFPDGAGLPDALMQSIAKELNLSETTFVLPPNEKKHDCRVRIFTPKAELPMAGHPTVGTAFVLAREGILKKPNIVFEEGIGPVPVSIELKDGGPGFIEMRQPLPTFGARFEDIDAIAEMLSLEPSAIRNTKLPVEVVSTGVPYLFVPLNELKSIRRARLRLDLWERLLRGRVGEDVFLFTTETEFPGSNIHSRMFAPSHNIAEDPATGSAHGPLGSYLVRHRVLPSAGELHCVGEQGVEMGRPSFLHTRITHQGDQITAVYVGGSCRYMGGGFLEIED